MYEMLDERVRQFTDLRDRMTALVARGKLDPNVVVRLTAFIDEVERYEIRLKVWEAGGCQGDPPKFPEAPDFEEPSSILTLAHG